MKVQNARHHNRRNEDQYIGNQLNDVTMEELSEVSKLILKIFESSPSCLS
jgi:hypothetical protein